MGKLLRYFSVGLVAVSFVADYATARCAEPDAPVTSGALLTEYQQELDSQWKKSGPYGLRDGKQRYSAERAVEAKFISGKVGNDVRKQQQLLDAILAVPDDGFAHAVYSDMVGILAKQSQSDRLRDLIAKRCPTQVGFHLGIEDIVIVLSKDTIHDGTLLLCDAYDKSTDATAKQGIAESLRRGFKKLVKLDGLDDQAAMRAIRGWYVAHANEYEPNIEYVDHLNSEGANYQIPLLRQKRTPNPLLAEYQRELQRN